MKPSNSRIRQDISHASRGERSVSSEIISGKNSDDDSVELASTIKTPRLESKTKKALNNHEVINKASTPDRSTDRSGSTHVSTESNRSDETVASQQNQAPIILAASEPRIEARTYNFILIASAMTGLSAPFVMILGPNDLAIRAAWFGVGAVAGLIVGSAYCFGDYMSDLRKQIQAQQRSEISPA